MWLLLDAEKTLVSFQELPVVHRGGHQHQAPVLPELPAVWLWLHGRPKLQSVAHRDQRRSSLRSVSNALHKSQFYLCFRSYFNGFPPPWFRKLYPELCQGIIDVAISSVFTLNSDSSSVSSSPYSSSPSSLFTSNSCSSPKLRGPLHVGPFTRL